MRKIICMVMGFIFFNLLVLGCMQVYKTSYNTMNSEHICIAKISSENDTAKLQVLDYTIKSDIIPHDIHCDDSIMYVFSIFAGSGLYTVSKIVYFIDKNYIDFL